MLKANLTQLLKDIFISPFFQDKKIWVLNSSGNFSSKSTFTSLLSPNSITLVLLVGRVWKPPIPPRVKAFSWLVALNCINRMNNLQWRRPYMLISPNWCVMCKKDEKKVNHLFIHCPFSSGIWHYFLSKSNVSWVMPKHIVNLFFLWNFSGLREKAKNFWDCIIHAIIWDIWKERYMRILEGKAISRNDVIDGIIREVGG